SAELVPELDRMARKAGEHADSVPRIRTSSGDCDWARFTSACSGYTMRAMSKSAFISLVVVVVGVVAAGGLTGCGTRQQDACDQFGISVCNALKDCDVDVFNRAFISADQCAARLSLSCSLGLPDSAATKPGDIVGCANALDNVTCDVLMANRKPVFSNVPEC